MLYVGMDGWMDMMGWDWMVIIGHRYSKSTSKLLQIYSASSNSLQSKHKSLYIKATRDSLKGP